MLNNFIAHFRSNKCSKLILLRMIFTYMNLLTNCTESVLFTTLVIAVVSKHNDSNEETLFEKSQTVLYSKSVLPYCHEAQERDIPPD